VKVRTSTPVVGARGIGEQPAAVPVARPHAAQIVQDRLWQGNPAFLVPLADHAQQPVGAVDRRDLKGGRLADAQAAGVHDGEARLVDGTSDRLEELADLLSGQGGGQPLLLGLTNLFLSNNGQARSSVWRYRNWMP
jgi:hypothetical protein